ncbi:hypothetical protein K7432_007196 [Basidiobolus ranarum]|uniref:Dehydrin n=1 Tax=Basidiobolus ranarum TaxID=34480 RepID=A0ABR2WU15_9FUNG
MDHTNIPGFTPGQGVPHDELNPSLIARERNDHSLIHDKHKPHHDQSHNTAHHETNHSPIAAIKEKVKGIFSKDKKDTHDHDHHTHTGANVSGTTAGAATGAVAAGSHPTHQEHSISSSSASSSEFSDSGNHKNRGNVTPFAGSGTTAGGHDISRESIAAEKAQSHHQHEAGLMAAAGAFGTPSAASVGIEHYERDHGHSGTHQYPGDHFPGEGNIHKGVEGLSLGDRSSQTNPGANNGIHNQQELGVGNIPVGNPEQRHQAGHVSNYSVNPDSTGAYPAVDNTVQSSTALPAHSQQSYGTGHVSSQNPSAYPAVGNPGQSTSPSSIPVGGQKEYSQNELGSNYSGQPIGSSSATYDTPTGNVQAGNNQPQYAPHDYNDRKPIGTNNIPGQY